MIAGPELVTQPTAKESPEMVTVSKSATAIGGGRVLALLLAAYILNLVDRQIVGVLAIPIKSDLAMTDTQLGLLGGFAFVLFYTVMGVPIGWLADRKSRVGIVAVSVAIWSLFTATCGATQSFVQLLLARVGVGVGEAGGVAPSHSLISDYFPPEKRGRALAIFSLGSPVGSALGILFGGWIASQFHWRTAFWFLGTIGIVLAPLIYLSIREPTRGRLDEPGRAKEEEPVPFFEAIRSICALPSFWLLAIGSAASALPSAGLVFWFPSYLRRSFGLDLMEISLFQGSIMLIGGGLGTWLGGWFSDRAGRAGPGGYALVPAIGFLIAAPMFLVAMFSPSLAIAWLPYLIWQAVAIGWLGPIIAAVQQIVAPKIRATASAAFLCINNIIGYGFGTFIMGFLSDYMTAAHGRGALRYAMLLSLSFYLIAFIVTGAAAFRLRTDWYANRARSTAASRL
jgi:MFS family permease